MDPLVESLRSVSILQPTPAETSTSPLSSSPKTTSPRNWRVTVLISGSGSNLQALLDALPTTLSKCTIVSVLSNKPSAYGLTRAASHSPPIPTTSLSLKQFKDTLLPTISPPPSSPRAAYELELARRVRKTKPDLIVLAGWMLILGGETLEALVRDWDEENLGTDADGEGLRTDGANPYPESDPAEKGARIPIINLHPALPGTFPGAHAIKDAWDAFNATDNEGTGKKIEKTGLMIHRVIPELDAGKPVVVREVELKEGESLDELEERIHKIEHEAIVDAVEVVVGMLRDGSWWKDS